MRAAFSNSRGSTCAGQEASHEVNTLTISEGGTGRGLWRADGQLRAQAWRESVLHSDSYVTPLTPRTAATTNAKFWGQGGLSGSWKVEQIWHMALHG